MRDALRLSILLAFAGALGTRPALALDCAKAKTPIENAICADPAAAAVDEAMSKAYDSLGLRLSTPDRAALLISQRRWLKRRDFICSGKSADSIATCLTDETGRRRAFLAGEPISGPGAAQGLAPVLIQHVGEPYQYDLDVNAVKFVDPRLPGEKLFNARVDALLKKVPKIDQTGFRQDMVYSYALDVSASFASPEFASAHVEIYDFSGGAHGNTTTSNFAIDLETGKELQFSDLFQPDAQPKFVAACLNDIKRQKQEKMPDDPFGVVSADEQKKVIEKSVADLTRWSLFATKGEVTFDPYALGAYVEGPYSCDFSAELMRPLLKLDYLAEQAAPQAPH